MNIDIISIILPNLLDYGMTKNDVFKQVHKLCIINTTVECSQKFLEDVWEDIQNNKIKNIEVQKPITQFKILNIHSLQIPEFNKYEIIVKNKKDRMKDMLNMLYENQKDSGDDFKTIALNNFLPPTAYALDLTRENIVNNEDEEDYWIRKDLDFMWPIYMTYTCILSGDYDDIEQKLNKIIEDLENIMEEKEINEILPTKSKELTDLLDKNNKDDKKLWEQIFEYFKEIKDYIPLLDIGT